MFIWTHKFNNLDEIFLPTMSLLKTAIFDSLVVHHELAVIRMNRWWALRIKELCVDVAQGVHL